MFTRKYLKYFICICVFALMSCSNSKVDNLLNEIYATVDSDKERALALVDSVDKMSDSFSEEQLNRYLVYRTMVRDKNNDDISDDTLIFKTSEFFQQKGDPLDIGLSEYFIGRVYQLQEKDELSIEHYLKAYDFIKKTDETRLKAMVAYNIGNNYLSRELNDYGISWYKDAVHHFTEINDIDGIYIVNFNIGSSYITLSETDSALLYYDRSMTTAKEKGNIGLQYKILKNIGTMHQNDKNYSLADKYFRDVLSLADDHTDSSRIYVYMADLFLNMDERDSVKYYTKKAMQDIDLDHMKAEGLYTEILNILSYYAEFNGDLKTALKYDREYSDSVYEILTNTRANGLLVVEKRYNNEKLLKEKNELIIARQKAQITLLIFVLAAIVIIALMYMSMKRYKNNLAEVEMKIDDMKEIAAKYKSETLELSKSQSELSKYKTELSQSHEMAKVIMNKYFNIITKTALIEGYMKEEDKIKGQKLLDKFNDVVYGKNSFDWDSFFITINGMKNNILDKVKYTFLDLDEAEYKVFCLAYCELSNTEISIIMGMNVNTVKSKKQHLRKKMGITGYSNFIDEVNQLVAR